MRLLEAVLDTPEPPALLLVLVLRDDLGDVDARRAIAASPVLGPSMSRVLEIGPLPQDDAHALVERLARKAERPTAPSRAALWAESIVLRAKGSPLFIAQLVLGSPEGDDSAEEIDRLVERRLDRLDPAAHRLLAVIAVAGGPLSETLALALVPDADPATLERLQQQGFVVGGALDSRGDARVETAHDRVREVMLASLEPMARAALHTALGESLLARHDDGDGLFRAVDQLDAGLLDAEHAQLRDDRRRMLAELNRWAGTRALEAAAWGPASRYFDIARRLVAPWIPQARMGGVHHRLCVDVMLGEARASHYKEDERWLDRTDELLRWSLSDADYSRTLDLQIEGLTGRGRYAETLERGITGLEHLGVRVPRSPSVVRVGLAVLRSWWAACRLDHTALLDMPAVAHERTRAIMRVIASMSVSAFNTNPALGLWLLCRSVVMIVKHGDCDRALITLVSFSSIVVAMFDTVRAIELHDACMAASEKRKHSPNELAFVRVTALLVLFPRVRPLRQNAAALEHLCRRLVGLGGRWTAEHAASFALSTMMDAGHHLSEIVKRSECWRQESRIRERSSFAQLMDFMVRCCEMLMHGPTECGLPDYESADSVWVRDYGAIGAMRVLTHFGDHARVLSIHATVERGILRAGLQRYRVALLAPFVSIATAECLPSVPVLERVRLRRRLRRYRRILRRWAVRVPEDYAPALDLVRAEHECLRGRFERAVTHYERALEAADNSGMVWLAGLAAERLARQAERHGHMSTREAALERARSFYDQWGATALVRRIDAQRTKPSAEPAGSAAAAS
ncbi:MAG: hypothetical protein AAGF11_27520 [Myxococcota bacterium]